MEGAEGRRALWHHDHAEWRGLVRLARRGPYRQDRYGERRRVDGGAAETRRWAPPHLVGFQGFAVGELLEHRRGRSLRSNQQSLESVEPAAQQIGLLRGLCGRQG